MSATIPRISAQALLDLQKSDSPVIVLDCTIDRGATDGRAHFAAEHIAGSRYFPYLDITSEGPFPATMPRTFAEFCSKMGKLGFKRSDKLVVYDQQCFFGSQRAAFVLATFGHPDVAYLDSYAVYKQLGGTTATGADEFVPKEVEYADPAAEKVVPKLWFELQDIVKLYSSGEVAAYNIIDARMPSMYAAGHLRDAVNIFYKDLTEDQHYKSAEQIAAILKQKGIDTTKPTVVYCNSGTTACVVKAPIDELLAVPAIVYDGSWNEYGKIGPKEYAVVA